MTLPICLLRGTRIRTPAGDRAAENIAIGDKVVTVSGAARPVKWVGRQHFRHGPGRTVWVQAMTPVRIRASALSEGVPSRDLYVSQRHALFLEGVLMMAGHLVNGDSIALAAPAGIDTLDYYNIELDRHDVIFAEGAMVETFLSRAGNRETFDNFVEYERLYGTEHAEPKAFAPRVGINGRADRFASRIRRALAPVVDRRTTLDRILDRAKA